MFNIKEFRAGFSTFYFIRKICVKCAFALQKMRVERRVFYSKISKRSCYVQHCTCTQNVAMHSRFNIKEFQAYLSTFFVWWRKFYFTWEKCLECMFKLNRMRVERRLFYPKISKRSCYVQHCTCTQNVAMHSRFNIKEFQAYLSTFFVWCRKFYFTWEKCVQCALKFIGNVRWKTGVLTEEIAAILLCTALYLHPKSSNALYVQYKRVSTIFYNAILYFKLVYFTWK